ncbi:2-amino-4-hydroxy-6-hydroxymethyldihydropteridine diphosphokinase [Sphingobium sp. AN641]|uniref:2-amino-4-hydroxy-6- hydroxymethyldihydropteridine diphosphokinase n=1 Tax=Sphingobium sp. AN641 TaxID=3133443 RepID=UPI0030C0409C
MRSPPPQARSYALALGSNRALSARLTPAAILKAAVAAIAAEIGPVRARSPIIMTAPVGPSRRRFANGALIVESGLAPPDLLRALQAIERRFGRKRALRWGARRLDIDIILWSGGAAKAKGLAIPHPAFAARDFVLTPLARIAPRWRDPTSGRTVAQLRARLRKPLRRG